MKENILLFGGNSFLGKAFTKKFQDVFNIRNVYRNNTDHDLNFDFIYDDAQAFTSTLNEQYNAVLFLQGANPSMGAKEITAAHFTEMLNINLVMPACLVKDLAPKLNKGALILFMSSVAKKKGSYDPAYGSAKAGLTGLMQSLANAWPQLRFNIISLGLVENSPVYHQMTPDFRQKHADRMFNNSFVKADDVINVMAELIHNQSINRTDIEIDGGYN